MCEGQTEEKYFKGLVTQKTHRRKFAAIDVAIYKPENNSPVGLIKKAKDLMKVAKRDCNDYDFVWVVFDKDQHASIPDAFEMARTNKPEIRIAFTSPCFEFFILLHFEKTTREFSSCGEIISYIKKKGYIPDYEKASNLFKVLDHVKEKGLAHCDWLKGRNQMELDDGARPYEFSAYSNVEVLIRYLYNLVQ
ncbi:MAG: RloB family protein [Cytophagales bacterium]|nr:RloB family protein [Cytophagales bacterium]